MRIFHISHMLIISSQDEMIRVCKSAYKNSVAKLVLQIAEPNILEIKYDIRVTFPDQLAVIGIYKENN